jgi:adenylate cyclase
VSDDQTVTEGRQSRARLLTSVELLDVAVWREIGSEEPQPQAAFLEALSALVGRWLLVRSNAPEMDLVTVMCCAHGYIGRLGAPKGDSEWKA